MKPGRKEFLVVLFLCSVTLLLVFWIRFLKDSERGEQHCETAPEPPQYSENTPLPDTIFPSAFILEYSVRYYDTLTPGDLNTLADAYAEAPGIFTFRGGPLRDIPNKGRISNRPSIISVDWEFRTDFDTTLTDFGRWGGGTGWTGQPLLVNWPDSFAGRFAAINDTLMYQVPQQEVIFGSLCGKIYFVDYETGKSTRRPFNIQNTIKGTPGMDPGLNGLLYIGHGIPRDAPMGITVFDLFTHQQRQFIPGRDPFALRGWPAFDASPIAVGQFLFWTSENGVLYKFIRTSGGLLPHSALRYKLKGMGAPGIESSLAVYKNYGFFGDNHGNILCINLNTMNPVWHYHNLDDTDATIVVEIENGVPYLYTGCEVDRQGNTGFSQITKLNGLNGSVVWQKKLPARSVTQNEKRYNGGMLSTPLLGQGKSNDMIYCIISLPDSSLKSDLIAFRKKDGHMIWKLRLDAWSWSSPVPFYTDTDSLFILAGDVSGMAYLIDGKTGTVLYKNRIGQNFESSPLVWENTAIFGSRGRSVFKLKIQ